MRKPKEYEYKGVKYYRVEKPRIKLFLWRVLWDGEFHSFLLKKAATEFIDLMLKKQAGE